MIKAQISEILVVTGILTMSGISLLLVPKTILRWIFGQSSPDLVTTTVARHWGLLLFLVGCLLVRAGHHPEIRTTVMIAAIIEKFGIATFVFASPLRARHLLDVIVGVDAIMAILYLRALW